MEYFIGTSHALNAALKIGLPMTPTVTLLQAIY
jgi:hypothetical protein